MLRIVCTWQPWPFGWIARKFGLRWSHAFLLRTLEDGRHIVYEATARGIWKHPLKPGDLGHEHRVYVTKKPLEDWQRERIIGCAEGMCGKPYNYFLLLRLAWRILKNFLGFKPKQAFMAPAEVCSSFVQNCYWVAGIDLVPGQAALPDDLANSPLVKEVGTIQFPTGT